MAAVLQRETQLKHLLMMKRRKKMTVIMTYYGSVMKKTKILMILLNSTILLPLITKKSQLIKKSGMNFIKSGLSSRMLLELRICCNG